MPTTEVWQEAGIIAVQWQRPLTAPELRKCFHNLKTLIGTSQQTTHVLFDIRDAGSIPAEAPVLAIRSKFLTAPTLGKIAVISTDVIAQILANVAAKVSKRDILFFPLHDAAVSYLKQVDAT